METTIYLIRHGETGWAEMARYAGRKDIPLNNKGYDQVERLAKKLAKLKLSAAYTSPLVRCVETTKILVETHRLPYQVVDDLVEIDFGEWDGLYRHEIETQYSQIWKAWLVDPCTVVPPGGESVFHVASRIVPAIYEIAHQNINKTIIIVAHKTVNRIFLAHILGIPVRDYREQIMQDASCINIIKFNGEKFRVDLMNSMEHMGPV